jgi:MurNAc alpha-1-phosphate uridylyltransferase
MHEPTAMRAMILAAGLGTRMGVLTDNTPKALLRAAGKPLLQFQLEALARSGFRHVVINHGRLGAQIEVMFGSGTSFGLDIHYSAEGEEPLETAGGIRRALPLLGHGPFLVVNADVWTDFDFASLCARDPAAAHIVLVHNPDHHPNGDFGLSGARVTETGASRLTYSGIGVYHPRLFQKLEKERAPLAPLLRAAIATGQVTGECHSGRWFDIGTPDRLSRLDQLLRSDS